MIQILNRIRMRSIKCPISSIQSSSSPSHSSKALPCTRSCVNVDISLWGCLPSWGLLVGVTTLLGGVTTGIGAVVTGRRSLWETRILVIYRNHRQSLERLVSKNFSELTARIRQGRVRIEALGHGRRHICWIRNVRLGSVRNWHALHLSWIRSGHCRCNWRHIRSGPSWNI